MLQQLPNTNQSNQRQRKMLFCSSVEKAKANTPLGLQFWMTPNASIIIISVDKYGLFGGRLKVGMHVEKVNDRFIGDRHGRGSIVTVAALQEYLAQLTGTVTIWAGDGSAHHHRLLLQTSSGNDCLGNTKKSPQDSVVLMETPRPSLVEASDSGSSDFSNCSGRDFDGGDYEPSSLKYDDDMTDEKLIEALFHRTTG